MDKELLKKMYKEHNKNMASMARALGCTRKKVEYHCTKYGINEGRIQAFRLSETEFRMLYNKFNHNKSALARHLEVSPKCIRFYVAKYGIGESYAKGNKPMNVGFEKLKGCILRGMTLEKTGKELNCSTSHVTVELMRNLGEKGYKALLEKGRDRRNMLNYMRRKND